MPWHLYVHGSILTAWIVLAFVQTILIAARRTRLHRRLGVAGSVIAAAVVIVSLVTLAYREAPSIDEAPGGAFPNLMSLVVFSLCVTSGVALRRRPAAHKRLMLLASIPLAGPALDRVSQLPVLNPLLTTLLNGAAARPGRVVATAGTFALVASVVINDLVLTRRVHGATVWGLVCFFVLGPAITAMLIVSGAWQDFVHVLAE